MPVALPTSVSHRALSGLFTATILATALAACSDGGSTPATPTATTPTPTAALANQLYTETDKSANAIVHYTRQADGSLVRAEITPTGGAGTNAVRLNGTPGPNSLGSQNAVIVSPDHKMLFAVNAGDNSITAFALDQTSGKPSVLKTTLTLGSKPNSLAFTNGYLYATFLNGPNQLGAYKVQADGSLAQVALYNLGLYGSLAGAAVPTQVVASPDNHFVVVSAGTASNAVLAFPINADGSLGAAVVNSKDVVSPFAGAYLPGKGASVYLSTSISGVSLTAFNQGSTGNLGAINVATASCVGAPCWLAVTPNGKFAYVGNGSGSISSFAIGADNGVTLLQSIAAEEAPVIAGVTSVAGDSWISPDGKFLYSTYLGDDKIVVYGIGSDGALNKLGEQVVGTATKLSLQGLAGI